MPGLSIPLIVLGMTIFVGVFSVIGLFSQIEQGPALCLIAAALAFGLASNAVWRQ